MRRAVLGFSTRALLVCVVLGAFTAVFVHLSRFLGVLFWTIAPWLGAPAPVVPWYMAIIVAALLVPRFGSALITGLIGAVVGIGTMALLAAIVIEATFAFARWWDRRRGTVPDRPGTRRDLGWALLASVLAGLMSYGFMFSVREFQLLPPELMLLALGVRIVTGVLFGWLAYLLVRGLLGAGFEPERPTRSRPGDRAVEGAVERAASTTKPERD